MKKAILFLTMLAGVMSLGGCAYPDHSGVYMDQHNGREEQSNADHRNDRYQDDNHDNHDQDHTDPRRQ